MGLSEGTKFALQQKTLKEIFFFSIVGLFWFVLIHLLATVLDPWADFIWITVYLDGTGGAACEAWCTICILLTLVAMLSDSFIQCLHMDVERKEENWSLWYFWRDLMMEMQFFPSLHCMHHYKKEYKPFYCHLRLLHFSLDEGTDFPH